MCDMRANSGMVNVKISRRSSRHLIQNVSSRDGEGCSVCDLNLFLHTDRLELKSTGGIFVIGWLACSRMSLTL